MFSEDVGNSLVISLPVIDAIIEDACGVSSPPPPKHPAPTIYGCCVSIFTAQMQKQREKQKQKHREEKLTAEIIAAFVETNAPERATAVKKMLR